MKEFLRNLGWPAVCGLLIALLIMQQFPHWLGFPANSAAIPAALALPSSSGGVVSYSEAVAKAAPAVANIFTTKQIPSRDNAPFGDSTLRDYADTLPAPARRQSSLGSAVILRSDGYLLTNNHVVADADEILIALRDGREAIAKLIGTDPETDLAVLKIDLPDLPAATITPEEQPATGDVVMAIGNPFGLGQTVTMGIISATGRNQLGLNTYEDFIQTDAAINQGNSGGALIDAHGRLIGINTAIFSQSGGSQGIGFAIPAHLAVDVMEEIIERGRVIRGWLGVEVQPLTSDLAESFGLVQTEGIVVSGLYRNGPAWSAGLRPGDVILRIDDKAIVHGRHAMNQVARAKPGSTVELEVLRNGEPMSFTAEVGVRPTFGS
ncbi:peptidase S1 and S6 chymotrypsin/Hap [Pseudomonas saudimassiliensis]|uniref:Peptidase S1 and S6 chymotrypsin/Hap n=1 Tax=Pseudomonas saudimassiliensis TaxID=1461581 RepID=A0A078M3J5_9PSED|nr:trypsin-like peptidase domain-containing protein [Pseudomonas saudimassiliensis]CEA00805.1 peptidase S1 and S6 chymotrypsin/Hap [Pseudomonas saudimassiliensis]CEF25271.1 peptidase S1 and S6 chymotrypsin/Hap [Pseudomonas saudimassiliensis]